ncbi:hypothetical protein E2C01_043093 [Portunus trituberculatus]|uniref:Uncharacterized protein n=1 Tax=Portunus trituberculatus TaxID=210409 RepID=A0A5B7FVD5_PORTR|nr:hypothetical protein [Portunus trituberculatus]
MDKGLVSVHDSQTLLDMHECFTVQHCQASSGRLSNAEPDDIYWVIVVENGTVTERLKSVDCSRSRFYLRRHSPDALMSWLPEALYGILGSGTHPCTSVRSPHTRESCYACVFFSDR